MSKLMGVVIPCGVFIVLTAGTIAVVSLTTDNLFDRQGDNRGTPFNAEVSLMVLTTLSDAK